MATYLAQHYASAPQLVPSDSGVGFLDEDLKALEEDPVREWEETHVVYAVEEETAYREEARLGELAAQLQEQPGLQLSVERITDSASAKDLILDTARFLDAHLIVMGANASEESLISRKIIGSTTTSVMRHCAQPLLIIPEHAPFKTPRKIVFATDYAHVCRQQDMYLLAELARIFGAEVILLHVNKPSQTTLGADMAAEAAYITRMLQEQSVTVTSDFVEHHDVPTGIEEYVKKVQADWLVMIPHWHSFLSRLLRESTTSHLAFETDIPLLTFPED